jgi:hypothetical protein
MDCIVWTDDLILFQQVARALAGGTGSIRTIASLDELQRLTRDDPRTAVIVDLNRPIAEIEQACRRVPEGTVMIGVASHVHVEKIRVAREAGFHRVLARGQVSQSLATELAKLVENEQ